MKKMFVSAAAAACVFMLGAALPAQAEETGVAGIHTWTKVGGKTCLLDHFHDGHGNGASKAKATSAAVSAWVGFTAWEYGSSWARWNLAVSKTTNCTANGGGSWSCNVSARPCRGR